MRPTAESLLTAFCSSRKRHLIITGDRGSGKSTLLKNMLALFEHTTVFPGFLTYAVRSDASARPKQVILCDRLTGETAVIGLPASSLTASYPCSPPAASSSPDVQTVSPVNPFPRSGRMLPVTDGLLGLGLASIRRAAASSQKLAVIDEIGYLEENCPAFYTAVLKLFEQKSVFAVVRREVLPYFLQQLGRDDLFVFDLDAPVPRIGAILMASGTGRRFRNAAVHKLLADFCGRPLIQPALDLASHPLLSCAVTVTRRPEIAALCESQHLSCVLHNQPLLSDTIRLGLDALPAALDGCLFLQGDQPLLTPKSIEALIRAFAHDQRFLYRLSWENNPGSPVLFPAQYFHELSQLPPDSGGSAVLRRHPEAVRLVRACHPYELLDADTPEALRTLEEKAGSLSEFFLFPPYNLFQ